MSGLRSTESRRDMLTINGFRVEIEGREIQGITTIGGIGRVLGEIESTDGGSGTVEFYSDQKKTYGPITMTYRPDPANMQEFNFMDQLVTDAFNGGVRRNFTFIKYNHGRELFRIIFYKGLFKSQNLPDFDKNGSGPADVSFEVSVAGWERL